jgi:hypothetical protein
MEDTAMSKQMVYLVTNDDDSADPLIRFFSSREKAEEWIGPGGDQYDIEEVELDQDDGYRNMLVHTVYMDMNSGNLTRESRSYVAYVPYGFRSDVTVSGFEGEAIARSSVSPMNAIEAAEEKRRQWLADGDFRLKKRKPPR